MKTTSLKTALGGGASSLAAARSCPLPHPRASSTAISVTARRPRSSKLRGAGLRVRRPLRV